MEDNQLPQIEWTPDVLKDDQKPLITEAAELISACNREMNNDEIVTIIMRAFWLTTLPVFKLKALPDCKLHRDGYFERVAGYDSTKWTKADMIREMTAEVEPETTIVEDCLRGFISRDYLFYLTRTSPDTAVGRKFNSNAACYRAIANMVPRLAYGPYLECLGELRADAAELEALCAREGLTCPPNWRTSTLPTKRGRTSGWDWKPVMAEMLERLRAHGSAMSKTVIDSLMRDIAERQNGNRPSPNAPRRYRKAVLDSFGAEQARARHNNNDNK